MGNFIKQEDFINVDGELVCGFMRKRKDRQNPNNYKYRLVLEKDESLDDKCWFRCFSRLRKDEYSALPGCDEKKDKVVYVGALIFKTSMCECVNYIFRSAVK